MEEPKMNRINCSDPQQNPAAGRLSADWLEETQAKEKQEDKREKPPYPSFCRPLNRD
ncbi:MAG: hypothetical protein HFJ79_03435 [Clostridiales bacterium]|nr:hypothetical protein [Clostridiales bacterium]